MTPETTSSILKLCAQLLHFQAKQQLSHAKEQWLQQHVLYEELSNLTMSYEMTDGEEVSAEDEEVQLFNNGELGLDVPLDRRGAWRCPSKSVRYT